MGLAASQARLLTITSRLSSVELKQQRIAMDKMRLANDTDAVSTKYTQALNNETLSFYEGGVDVPMDYDGLVSRGYSVKRASDGMVAKEKDDPLLPVEKPTCPRATEYVAPTKPATSVDEIMANSSAGKKQDIQRWQAALPNIKAQYGEYPVTTKTTSMEELFKNCAKINLTNWDGNHITNMGHATSIINENTNNLYDLITRDNLMRIGDDGDKKGVPVAQAQNNVQYIAEAIMDSITKGLGISDRTIFQTEVQSFLDSLKNSINGYQDKNRHNSEKKATRGAQSDATNNIIGNGTDTGGTDHDFYFLNVSELARRLMQIALNKYAGQSFTPGTTCDSAKSSFDTKTQYTMTYNSKGYTPSAWEAAVQPKFRSICTNGELSWADAIEVVKVGAKEEAKANAEANNTSYVDPDLERYQKEYDEYIQNVRNAESAWTAYDNYITEKEARESNGGVSKNVEFYNQLKNNPQFLIQGLLSGYLTLLKDGKEVSLSSSTDINRSYDKSDDAAAEAEYNAQMNKINRKEKMLDMQAKRLDTEYSALTTEYNSIKSIIDSHTQKDFSYFS